MVQKVSSVIKRREHFSEQRLQRLRQDVTRKPEIKAAKKLCIYVTGSYGRLEASKYSDLDLFFIHQESKSTSQLSRADKALLDAALIKGCSAMRFPPFTRGGEYLDIHYLPEILKSLGSPLDDSNNYFTARLLLLLESKCVYNQLVYEQITERIIEAYFRDYHDHEKNFSPVFLVNDILRFWRTLCLNYEHNRDREPPANTSISKKELEIRKHKSYLKNVKLKFSRLLTCYSAIAATLVIEGAVTPEGMNEIVKMTPIDRLLHIAEERPQLDPVITDLTAAYSWFLEITEQPEDEMLRWIGNKKNRTLSFAKAREFGSHMFDLILNAPKDRDKIRYLVV